MTPPPALDTTVSVEASTHEKESAEPVAQPPSPPPRVSARAKPSLRPPADVPANEDAYVDFSTPVRDPEEERSIFSTDHFVRQWGRVAMRNRSEEVDAFGLDPAYEARVRPMLRFLYRRYFRTEITGMAHVPASGAALIVANHGGALPWDGLMLRTAILEDHPEHRAMRWLTEDDVFHAPFLGAFVNRMGAVRACQENAERVLASGALTAVFPEGIQGLGKLYRQRYQLQRFGRGGYIKLALRTRTPIIPAIVVGAEETAPLLFKLPLLAKAMGLAFVPVTPTFPLLGPLGLLPLPAKWSIDFGPALDLTEYGPEAAEDSVVVNRLNDRVRTTLQALLDKRMETRKSAFRSDARDP